MIAVSFSPDSGGAYLVETKLSQPVPATDAAILRLAAEIPPDATFPTGSVGSAGMLVPARYEGSDLVSVYSPGQSIDLPTAIGNFGRQLNGETVSDPYIFSPNTRRYLVQDGTLLGWQTVLLAPSEFSAVPASALVMGRDGSSPLFYDGAGIPSLGGWWGDAYSSVSNFFTGDAPLWQKVAVGGVASVGLLITGLLAFKAAAAAGAIAAVVTVLKGLSYAVAATAGTYLASVTATGLGYLNRESSDGFDRAQKGGAMPESVAGKIGYAAGQAAMTAAKVGRAIRDLETRVGGEYENAMGFLRSKSDDLSRRLEQYSSWMGALRPWLIGGGVAALGLLAYQLYTRRGR